MGTRSGRKLHQGPRQFFAQISASLYECAERLGLHREDAGGVLCHPAGLHIWKWFLELCRTRSKHTIMIAGGLGSQIIHKPAAITYTEIAAWETVTGRKLNRFEAKCITTIDAIWMHASSGGKNKTRRDQGIGEYCQNKSLEKCTKQFGPALPQVCSTCPT